MLNNNNNATALPSCINNYLDVLARNNGERQLKFEFLYALLTRVNFFADPLLTTSIL